MAEADTQTTEQCKAITESGDRCSRPAQDDGFCYQHDESDSTVDDGGDSSEGDGADSAGSSGDDATTDDGSDSTDDRSDSTGDGSDADADERTETMSESETEPETHASETEIDADATDPEAVDADDVEVDEEGIASILEIRRTVESTAGELIGHEFDGVSEISPTDEGWRGVVEVVERSSIPDTMDILGRYEIDLTGDGTVRGYRRIDRYRRNDTDEFD